MRKKKNISHFRYVGRIDLFLTEKIKKGFKNTLERLLESIPASPLLWHWVLHPSCSFFQTAGAPALPFVHHHHGCWPKPQGQLKSVSSRTQRDPSVCVPPLKATGGAAATTRMRFFITNVATWAGYAVWTSSNIKGASGIQLWGATSVKSGALVCPACLWICCLCWKSNSTPVSHKPPETQAGSSSVSSTFPPISEAGAQLKLHSFEGTSTEEPLTLFSVRIMI